MSHEIRTPLNAILGFAELLLHRFEKYAPDRAVTDAAKYLPIIIRNGRSLLALINDILDLAKIEAGQLQAIQAPFDVAALLTEVSNTFSYRAERKGLKMVVNAANLPERVIGDVRRLRQILFNVVGNAVKFTDTGTVSIETEGRPDHLLIQVRDTGVGIPSESLQKLFTPFFQADQSTSRRYEGTGLGLSIVQRLLELLSGSIRIDSEPGKGTVVTIVFPITGTTATHSSEDSKEHSRSRIVQLLQGISVVLMEDDLSSALYLSELLKSQGATVRTVESLDQLSTLLREGTSPDLIYLDIQLPGQSGVEILSSLRQMSELAQVKVIAQTAHTLAWSHQKCLAAGFDGYLAKPFFFADFLSETRRVMGI